MQSSATRYDMSPNVPQYITHTIGLLACKDQTGIQANAIHHSKAADNPSSTLAVSIQALAYLAFHGNTLLIGSHAPAFQVPA